MKSNKYYIAILSICTFVLLALYIVLIVMNAQLRSQTEQQSNTINYLVQKQSTYEQLLDSIDNLNREKVELQQEVEFQKDLLLMAERQYNFRVVPTKKKKYTEYFLEDVK